MPARSGRQNARHRKRPFETIAREWLQLKASALDPRTHQKKCDRFDAFVFPYLGKHPIADIKAPDPLAALRRIEVRGKNETAHRVRSECGAVLRYAIATGRVERDVSADLRGALAPVLTRNHPAITEPVKIGELLRAIYGYRGRGQHQSTEFALKLLPQTFVLRDGESQAIHL